MIGNVFARREANRDLRFSNAMGHNLEMKRLRSNEYHQLGWTVFEAAHCVQDRIGHASQNLIDAYCDCDDALYKGDIETYADFTKNMAQVHARVRVASDSLRQQYAKDPLTLATLGEFEKAYETWWVAAETMALCEVENPII